MGPYTLRHSIPYRLSFTKEGIIHDMTLQAVPISREFKPGTTGWTAADLDDPLFERAWMRGNFEIVEGVLTSMPAAYHSGGRALYRLMTRVTNQVGEAAGNFSIEAEIIVDEARVARADAAYLTIAEETRQSEAARAAGRDDTDRTRILISPTLLLESISPGHELHDRRTKRRWYAEFGVPNYWLLDTFNRSLECLVLDGGAYRVDAAGRGDDEVRPSLFPGLAIRLRELWSI
jgi:Uma2 family endonuclease